MSQAGRDLLAAVRRFVASIAATAFCALGSFVNGQFVMLFLPHTTHATAYCIGGGLTAVSVGRYFAKRNAPEGSRPAPRNRFDLWINVATALVLTMVMIRNLFHELIGQGLLH